MSPETPGLQIQTVVRLYWTTSEQIEELVSGIPSDFCGPIYVITNLPRRERERAWEDSFFRIILFIIISQVYH